MEEQAVTTKEVSNKVEVIESHALPECNDMEDIDDLSNTIKIISEEL